MTEGLYTLLGVVIGALLGGVLNVVTSKLQLLTQAKAVAAAIGGEIVGLVKTLEDRHFEELVERIMDAVSKAPDGARIERLRLPVKLGYFSVFEANCSQLGLLGARLASDVTSFYTRCKGFVEFLNDLAEGADHYAARQHSLEAHQEVLGLFRSLRDQAAELAAELDSVQRARIQCVSLRVGTQQVASLPPRHNDAERST